MYFLFYAEFLYRWFAVYDLNELHTVMVFIAFLNLFTGD